MKAFNIAKTAIKGIVANKVRSGLTILGVVIGITAIILVMAVGSGAEELILGQIRGFGSTSIIIEPGREPSGPSDFAEVYTDSLKEKDVEALQKPGNVPGLKNISPMIVQIASVSYGNESTRSNVRGSSPYVVDVLDLGVQDGQFFVEEDVKQNASVAVIGTEVKKDLFGDSDAVGKKIKIKNITFRVVGVLKKKGSGSFIPVDDMVFVPYTTARKYLLGIDYYHVVFANAESEASLARVVKDVEYTLRESHGITDPDKDDFHVSTQQDAIERIGIIATVLTILLVSIAAISLVVGGVGIMNIMLVSVTERTREIGLRKALGAKDKDILIQFLFEAMTLTGVGGIVGIIAGGILSFITSLILSQVVAMGWTFSFPITAALMGVGVSFAIGLVFGIYPARIASQKSPIEALRFE